jgi:hypothetical protein
LKTKESVPAKIAPQQTATDLKSASKPQLKVNSLLVDEFCNKLRQEILPLVSQTLPGDASLLLPPIQIAANCLRYGLGAIFTQFKNSSSRPDPMISKFAPILDQASIILKTVLPECFLRHKVVLADLYNCDALFIPPLPSEADLPTAIRKKLLPQQKPSSLLQTKQLMLRWESVRNPEFDRDSEHYALCEEQDHDHSYKAKKMKVREEARQRLHTDLAADGLMPQPLSVDDEDNFLRKNPDFHES